MKRLLIVTLIISIGLPVTYTSVEAQRMQPGQMHSHANQVDTNHQAVMMNMTEMMKMQDSISSQSRMIAYDFEKLKQHFERMEKNKDMGLLVAEMKKHHDLMLSLEDRISKLENAQNRMSEMVHAGGIMHAMNVIMHDVLRLN